MSTIIGVISGVIIGIMIILLVENDIAEECKIKTVIVCALIIVFILFFLGLEL